MHQGSWQQQIQKLLDIRVTPKSHAPTYMPKNNVGLIQLQADYKTRNNEALTEVYRQGIFARKDFQDSF